MTTRSLTDIFVLMRTNSIQSRGIYSFQGSKHNDYESDNDDEIDDKAALMETGRSMRFRSNSVDMRSQQKSPPTWAGLLEDAQYSITRFHINNFNIILILIIIIMNILGCKTN